MLGGIPVDVAEICQMFGLGVAAGPLSYVARGELGRVSRLATSAGVWAIKEIDLFVPTVDEADANVELQELMIDAGLRLPCPRRTVDGHGVFGNVRVYEWLDMSPLARNDVDTDELVAESLARMHVHAPITDGSPDPWYYESLNRQQWQVLLDAGAGSWWATAISRLLG